MVRTYKRELDATNKQSLFDMIKGPAMVIVGAGAAAALLSGSDFVDATTAMNGGLGVTLGIYAGSMIPQRWAPLVGAVAVPAVIGGELDAVVVGSAVAGAGIYYYTLQAKKQ